MLPAVLRIGGAMSHPSHVIMGVSAGITQSDGACPASPPAADIPDTRHGWACMAKWGLACLFQDDKSLGPKVRMGMLVPDCTTTPAYSCCLSSMCYRCHLHSTSCPIISCSTSSCLWAMVYKAFGRYSPWSPWTVSESGQRQFPLPFYSNVNAKKSISCLWL